MSEHDLDPELRDLVELERAALVEPVEARARLAARLGSLFAATSLPPPAHSAEGPSSLGEGAPPTPAASAPPTPAASAASAATTTASAAMRWTTLLSALAGGAVLGSAVTATALRTPAPSAEPPVEIRYVDRIVEVERAPDAAAQIAPTLPSSTAPRREYAQPSATAHAEVPHTEVSDQTLARERQIIDQARSALARRDSDAALAAVDEHARAHPHGQLVEMREALAVQALVVARRASEAQARAARFHARFPGSLYAPIVDAAQAPAP